MSGLLPFTSLHKASTVIQSAVMLQVLRGVHFRVQTLACIAHISYQDQEDVFLFCIKYCEDSYLQSLLRQLRMMGQGSRFAAQSLLLDGGIKKLVLILTTP